MLETESKPARIIGASLDTSRPTRSLTAVSIVRAISAASTARRERVDVVVVVVVVVDSSPSRLLLVVFDIGETTNTAGVSAPASTRVNARAPTSAGNVPNPKRLAPLSANAVFAMPRPRNTPHRTLVAVTPRARAALAHSSNAALALA